MTKLALAITSALLLAGTVATAASAATTASRLWYRIRVDADERMELRHAPPGRLGLIDEQRETTRAGWIVSSNAAVIVKMVCTQRSTGQRLAEQPCVPAYAAIGKRPPADAVDDLAFNAGAMREFLLYDWERKVPEREFMQDGVPVRCTERKLWDHLFAPIYHKGSVSSSSLVLDGASIELNGWVRKGVLRVKDSGYKCTYDTPPGPLDQGASRHELVSPLRTDLFKASWLPDTAYSLDLSLRTLARLKVGNARGVFGGSFSLERTARETGQDGAIRRTRVRLVFDLCPRGGRTAHGC